jgi:hypothetical protein
MPETPGLSDPPPLLADRLDAILAALAFAMVAADWQGVRAAAVEMDAIVAEVRAAESRERAEPREAVSS